MLGYVPDQPYLYDKLTGREFLKFVVEMYGLEPQRSAQRIDELIETFEMGDYVDELCESYSQGMKQRVVFASALVHDPKVLVVDEPLVGLDPRSARIVKDLFITQARSGCTVLMSTHLLAIAEELADRIGIVDHGRMLAVGTLEELRDAGAASRAARRAVPEADRRPSPGRYRCDRAENWPEPNHEPRASSKPKRFCDSPGHRRFRRPAPCAGCAGA